MQHPRIPPTAVVILLATFIAMAAFPYARLQARPDPTELEGTWAGEYSVSEGARRDLKPGEVRMTFKGDELFAVGVAGPGPQERQLSFVINQKTKPKTLDFWDNPAKKTSTIYEIDKDTLRIAFPRGSLRPTTISGEKGSMAVLLVLKKRKS